MCDYWGDLPSLRSDNIVGLTAAEKESLLRIPRPLVLEGPKIYQPRNVSAWKTEPKREGQEEQPVPVTRLGVQLQERLRSVELGGEDLVKLVQLPTSSRSKNPFSREYFRPQATVPAKPFIGLSPQCANAKLRKVSAEILAFVGFKSSSEEALQCLTDVAADFLRRMTTRLGEERDEHLLKHSTGFADVLERVLSELNLPSVLGLREFYETEVLEMHQNLVENCIGSSSSLHGVLSPIDHHQSYFLDSQEDIPEIHFPSSDEGDIDHATPQLETGLQMLQSLEQGSLGSQGGQPAAEDEGPLSHDSNSALLLATVSPAGPDSKKRKKS